MTLHTPPLPAPYYDRDGIGLYQGDCRAVLADLPADSVSACVTSPPYWGLRKYECETTVWGGCDCCGIRPDERLVTPNLSGQSGDGWEWRLGRDGVRRAVWLNGRKA